MFKRIVTVALIFIIAGLGIGYAIINDPDVSSHQLFRKAIVGFSENASDLDKQYRDEKKFQPAQRRFSIEYLDSDNQPIEQIIEMQIEEHSIILKFLTSTSALSEQTIILEPLVKEGEDNRVYWRCINGSVLVRFRTKNCRLGYGFLMDSLRT